MLTVSLYCVLFLFVFVKQKHNTEILSTLGTPDTGQRQTKTKHNTEILSTLGTPDTGQRQTNKKHNTEILSTLGTPDTGQRQTNKNTTQRYSQHWIHQTQNKDKQKKHNTKK
jgi:uncharacterized membrane protein